MERYHDRPPLGRDASAELVGPYALLTEIARGDLSIVYLATRPGMAASSRPYALKRLKPALRKNPDCVELLLDEARFVADVGHGNLASILDVGGDAGGFVVMEYIEGDNLESLLVRAGAARHPRYVLPPFVDALLGLQALHTAADASGSAAGIVHQAPRARHIQLGVDGVARLVDFSQLRARGVRSTRSRSDRLKVAYMAPEQALHPDGVDSRADTFIVGIALWEALTGERLFAADTDEQTFQNMLHRRIPRPSEVGLRPPRCFDAICMRALERDPKARFASAADMARELREVAQQQALFASPDELGRWVRHLVGRELRERRRAAGLDTPSSDILLQTPAAGLELPLALGEPKPEPAPLADGLTVLPSAADVDEDPYATGRIYGGSQARIVLEDSLEHDKTPALGLRRKPLPREEEDDEPTTQHAASTASSAVEAAAQLEARARAETQPVLGVPPLATPAGLAPKTPAPARAAGSESRALQGPRPLIGAVREDLRALEREEEKTQPSRFVPARPGARRDASTVSPGAYIQVDSSRRAARARAAEQASQETPAAPAAEFEEVDTERRSRVPEAEARERKSPVPREVLDRRAGAVTEHPPMYVQRRDSSPSRLEIPAGPVGAPHRPFAPELLSPRGRTSSPGEAAQGWSPAPVDSLTPPLTAAHTAPPTPAAPRTSTLWLVSAGIAAVVLLGVGIGLRQWGFAPGSAVPQAASGAPHAELPPPAQIAPAPEPAAAPTPTAPTPPAVEAGEQPASASPPPEEAPAPAQKLKPLRLKPAKVELPADETAAPVPVKKAIPARKVSGLPDNPY